jgi:hypothetical protein
VDKYGRTTLDGYHVILAPSVHNRLVVWGTNDYSPRPVLSCPVLSCTVLYCTVLY